MSEILCLLAGLMLGGIFSTVILCCFQINRANNYEREIRRLKKQLADNKK